MKKPPLFPQLEETISSVIGTKFSKERCEVLQPLIDYIQSKASKNQEALLNFICTHNSRRSQFAQVWAQTAAYYYNVKAICYSGGVEVTTFNERAVAAVKRAGLEFASEGKDNPKFTVSFSEETEPLIMFSKLYDDDSNPIHDFAAIMTCSHADKNCPFISGTEARIPVMYDDPKEFDDSPQEILKYDERSMQIAREMFYVFSQIKNK